jgi:hypothetical protein
VKDILLEIRHVRTHLDYEIGRIVVATHIELKLHELQTFTVRA